MSDPIDLTAKVKNCFDNRDYEGLVQVMNWSSKTNPDDREPERNKGDEQRILEDQKLAEEFEIHIENLKNEAIRQFDKELYMECLGTLRFLCQLEPENGTMRDYLDLCLKLTGTAAETPPGDSSISSTLAQEVAFQDCSQHAIETSTPGQLPEDVREIVNLSEARRGTARTESVHTEGLFDDSQILEIPGYSDVHPSLKPVGGQLPTPTAFERKPSGLAMFRRKRLTLALAVTIVLATTTVIGLRFLVDRRHSPPSVSNTQLKHTGDPQSSQGSKEMVAQSDTQVQLLQKAEACMLAGRYNRPARDNAVAYCDQVLAANPHSQKGLDLRKASIRKAAVQAKIRARAGRIEEARDTFISLLEMSQHESSFPYSVLELEKELRKLEFESYPVVHNHFLFGNCTGQLRFNSYIISYEPLGRSRHGFTAELMEIRLGEPGEKLKIQVGRRTYRFEPGPGENILDRQQKVQAIYRQLAHLGVRIPS
jgi:hypothetical protein